MSRPSLTKAQQAYLAAVRSDPMVFMQQAFQSIYPRQQLMLNWHIDAMVNRPD